MYSTQVYFGELLLRRWGTPCCWIANDVVVVGLTILNYGHDNGMHELRAIMKVATGTSSDGFDPQLVVLSTPEQKPFASTNNAHTSSIATATICIFKHIKIKIKTWISGCRWQDGCKKSLRSLPDWRVLLKSANVLESVTKDWINNIIFLVRCVELALVWSRYFLPWHNKKTIISDFSFILFV